MFRNSAFNNDISQWNVRSLRDATDMFYGGQFNQSLCSWLDRLSLELSEVRGWDYDGYHIGYETVRVDNMFHASNCPMTEDPVFNNISETWEGPFCYPCGDAGSGS